MATESEQYAKLLQLLAQIGFAERYYGLYEQRKGLAQDDRFSRVDHEGALAKTGLDFKYHASERFFGHQETVGACQLIFNVMFRDGTAELILALKTPAGTIGAPFHLLAAEVARLKNPDHAYDPAYPRIPLGGREQMEEAVMEGAACYREVRAAILREDWGCS